jgi:hypothetical protein
LAEIRLEQGDTKTAVMLLRRMTLVVGEPFENLADAAELLNKTGHPAEALPFLSDRVRAVPWDLSAKAQLGKLLVAAGADRDRGILMLRATAESNEATYETRAAAARFLGESKAAVLATASAELNLLSGPAPIPTASAEKPYFYYARLAAAAQSSDAAVKIRLWEGAASIEPDSDDPKLALFDEAYRAKRYQTAIAAIYPLILRGGISVPAEQPESVAGQAVEDQNENRYYTEQFINGAVRYGRHAGAPAVLDPARRAAIARELADSYTKLNMPREAAFYCRIALQLDPADTEAKTQLSLLQSQLEHQRANRQRQPVITENLEQEHAVRPRLAVPSGAQGGGQ